ncbi:hypothetical protein GGR52DRAFT_94083 [Hypoxylon sp. FL1284]|nr:hypothetical protein GGR52DRAFT_94083 [Hypoxylon sp. FL1284]
MPAVFGAMIPFPYQRKWFIRCLLGTYLSSSLSTMLLELAKPAVRGKNPGFLQTAFPHLFEYSSAPWLGPANAQLTIAS